MRPHFPTIHVYVDDIIVVGNCLTLISTLKNFLHHQFQIKNLGTLKYFMGLEVTHSPTNTLLKSMEICFEYS